MSVVARESVIDRIVDRLSKRLDVTDDHGLWRTAVDKIVADVYSECPHSIRIGKFAGVTPMDFHDWEFEGPLWASGFGGSKREGMPKLIWEQSWQCVDGGFQPTASDIILEGSSMTVAFPLSTSDKMTAGIQVLWSPATITKQGK